MLRLQLCDGKQLPLLRPPASSVQCSLPDGPGQGKQGGVDPVWKYLNSLAVFAHLGNPSPFCGSSVVRWTPQYATGGAVHLLGCSPVLIRHSLLLQVSLENKVMACTVHLGYMSVHRKRCHYSSLWPVKLEREGWDDGGSTRFCGSGKCREGRKRRSGAGAPDRVLLTCLLASPLVGLPGPAGMTPRVAFTAALTSRHVETGTIPFDSVLVNDGNFYDPDTGQWAEVAPKSGYSQ